MTSAAGWLAPLLSGVPGFTDLDDRRLHRFEEALAGQLALQPVGPDVETSLRSQRLARIRRELAAAGHLALAVPARDGGVGCPPEVQALMQFICGYHDADLRDATGLGHGRLIARHASPPARDRWLPRLLAGDLTGIAITESHGGSQVHATATAATPHRDGRWRLSGTKTWISRLEEAAVFIVFFTDPAGHLTAGIVDAGADGLDRRTVRPSGLAGWSWGELRLHELPLHLSDVLGRPGQGMEMAIAASALPGQSPPDLMLAAAHYLLAREPADPLARYYPTLTPQPATGNPAPAFREFCMERCDQLTTLVSTRRVQTNEVRRCCYLLPAVMLAAHVAARPLALIEAGASAGLNLAMDHYAYNYGTGTTIGDTGSPLTLQCRLDGTRRPPLKLPIPQIGWRAGIDLHPLDPASPDDAAWLRALVWADHPGRAAVLAAALKAAAARPPVPLHAGDAAERLPALIASAPADMTVCLFHTAFLAHIPPLDRERFEHLVADLSTTRLIYWVQAEPRPDPAEPRLRLTACEEGRITGQWPLGRYHPHGEWLEWAAVGVPVAA